MSELLNIISKLNYSAVVDCKKCLRGISTKSNCDLCLKLCPEKSVKLTSSNKITIDKNCSNCGICVWNCPAQAISYPKMNEDIRLKRIYLDPNIPLENFTLNYFAYLYLKGVREILRDYSVPLLQSFESNFQTFQLLLERNHLETLKISQFTEKEWVKLAEQAEISRAELFSGLIKVSKNTFEAFLAKKENIEDYLLKLFPNKVENSLYNVYVNHDCNQCKACIMLCPKKCLELRNNKVVLVGSCNGCQLCRDVCPQNSIRLNSLIP